MIFMNYLVYDQSNKYFQETWKIKMALNEKMDECKGFAFPLKPEHEKEILKLNRIKLGTRITVTEDATSTRKTDKQNLQ